jgi:hypothetical protein
MVSNLSTTTQCIRERVAELHRELDEVTKELQTLEKFRRTDVVRRAEEAGAALARLEWALDRTPE